MRNIFLLFIGLFLITVQADAQISQTPSSPQVTARYASIAVDADTHEILHARQIDELRYPASLTKMMTLYLTFDAIEAGKITLDDLMTVSSQASKQPPVKLGLKRGEQISVHDAVQALSVKSANDVAVVLAEYIGTTELNFADMMTQKAQQLGMQATTYRNASGLPDPWQVTTARDQAKLADNLLRNHRRFYHYFGQNDFVWKGRRHHSHNKLLGNVKGVDGFKTGYTHDSGYNLTISAQRNGRRIIAVVLGGASGKSRDDHMRRLIDRSFDVLKSTQPHISTLKSSPPPSAPNHAQTLLASAPKKPVIAFTIRGKNNQPLEVRTGEKSQNFSGLTQLAQDWSIQLGAFDSPRQAQQRLNKALDIANKQDALLKGLNGEIKRGQDGYRPRLIGLNTKIAYRSCEAIKQSGFACFVIAPSL